VGLVKNVSVIALALERLEAWAVRLLALGAELVLAAPAALGTALGTRDDQRRRYMLAVYLELGGGRLEAIDSGRGNALALGASGLGLGTVAPTHGAH